MRCAAYGHMTIYPFYFRKRGLYMELLRDKRVKDAYMNVTIQDMFDRGELRRDHPLQRKPGRWNKSEKDGLIATVIRGEDIDSIKVCEQLTSKGVVLWVIDGLQRLTTLNSYKNGAFKLGSKLEMPVISYQQVKKDARGKIVKDQHGTYVYEIVEYNLCGKGYKDLPVELKDSFDNYKIDVVLHAEQEDIEQYEEVLDDLTLNVDNSSRLLDRRNHLSLLAMVAYSFERDVDLDDWIVDFFRRNRTFVRNQKENYLRMRNDLEQFISDCKYKEKVIK